MKSHHPKLILLSIIFLAASVMYWSLFNNFILKNTQPEAAAGKVEVSFLEDTVTVSNPDTDLIDVNVFFTSTELVQRGTISFQYSRELQYMQPIIGRDVISAVCTANGFTHTQLLDVQFDNMVGGGHISRVVPGGTTSGSGGPAPTGFFCYTTLTFMSKPGGLLAQSGTASINLWDPADPACMVGGGVVGGGTTTGNLCIWLLTDPAGAVHTPFMSPTRNTVNVVVAGGGGVPTPTTDPAIDLNVTPTNAAVINPTVVFQPIATPTPAFVDVPTATPVVIVISPTKAPFACNKCPLGINYCATGPGSDYELLQQCIFGTAAATVNCLRFDINGDGVVDAADLAAFGACTTCNCSVVPTVVPTSVVDISPTTAPGSNNCPRRPQGDLNCDGTVDLVDFNMWRIAFIAYLQSGTVDKHADITEDGKVTLPDFEIIRTHLQLN